MAQAVQLSGHDVDHLNKFVETDGILTAIAVGDNGAVIVYSSHGLLSECLESMTKDFGVRQDVHFGVAEAINACGNEFYAKTGGVIAWWFAPIEF